MGFNRPKVAPRLTRTLRNASTLRSLAPHADLPRQSAAARAEWFFFGVFLCHIFCFFIFIVGIFRWIGTSENTNNLVSYTAKLSGTGQVGKIVQCTYDKEDLPFFAGNNMNGDINITLTRYCAKASLTCFWKNIHIKNCLHPTFMTTRYRYMLRLVRITSTKNCQ